MGLSGRIALHAVIRVGAVVEVVGLAGQLISGVTIYFLESGGVDLDPALDIPVPHAVPGAFERKLPDSVAVAQRCLRLFSPFALGGIAKVKHDALHRAVGQAVAGQ